MILTFTFLSSVSDINKTIQRLFVFSAYRSILMHRNDAKCDKCFCSVVPTNHFFIYQSDRHGFICSVTSSDIYFPFPSLWLVLRLQRNNVAGGQEVTTLIVQFFLPFQITSFCSPNVTITRRVG